MDGINTAAFFKISFLWYMINCLGYSHLETAFDKSINVFRNPIQAFFLRAVTAYLTSHHNLLTLPAFTAWLCRVFITSLVIEMLLSTYQFPTIKRGCFPWAEGSITSRLMTGRVPDCRQAPCTCFSCAPFLYISAENISSYSFQRADETTDLNICLISLHRFLFLHLDAETVMCNFHLPVERRVP